MEEIKNFLERTLNGSNLHVLARNGREATITEVLDEAAKRLKSERFTHQPEVKAELEHIIADSYYEQGKYDIAKQHLRSYLALRSKLYGEDDLQVLAQRAANLFTEGRLNESEKLFRAAIPRGRMEVRRGNLRLRDLVSLLENFAFLRRTQGDSREAEALFREAIPLTAKIPPEESDYLQKTIRSTLASVLAGQGRFNEALKTAERAVTEFRRRGETNSDTYGFALIILGGFLTEKGDFAQATATLDEAESILRKVLDPSNLWLGDNSRNQALLLYDEGRFPESLAKIEDTLRIYQSFGPHYDQYPTALITEGLDLAKTGRTGEGEKVLREAVAIRTQLLPQGHYWIAQAQSALGKCLTMQKRYAEAEPLLLKSYQSLAGSQGPDNPRTQLALRRLVELYRQWGMNDAAALYEAKLSSLPDR